MVTPDSPSPLLRRLLCGLIVCLLALVVAPGCGDDEADPKKPEGALRLFVESIPNGDAKTFWEYLDPESKVLFKEHLQTLIDIDQELIKHFSNDPTELQDLRRKAGISNALATLRAQREATATKAAERGETDPLKLDPRPRHVDLFMYVVTGGGKIKPFSNITFEDDQEVGADVDEIEFSEDKNQATIKTDGGQTYILTRREDGEEGWYVTRSSPAFLILDKIVKVEKNERESSNNETLIVCSVTGESGTVYHTERSGKGVWLVPGLSRAYIKGSNDSCAADHSWGEKDGVVVDIFSMSLMPIHNSHIAIKQYAQEKIDEELKRRTRIVGYFNKAIQPRK